MDAPCPLKEYPSSLRPPFIYLGSPSILFSSWTNKLGIFTQISDEHNIRYVRIDGEISYAERTRRLVAFQEDPSISTLLMTVDRQPQPLLRKPCPHGRAAVEPERRSTSYRTSLTTGPSKTRHSDTLHHGGNYGGSNSPSPSHCRLKPLLCILTYCARIPSSSRKREKKLLILRLVTMMETRDPWGRRWSSVSAFPDTINSKEAGKVAGNENHIIYTLKTCM